MQLGSYEHRKLFCQELLEGQLEYDPSQLWPQLDEVTLLRLREIPFWSKILEQKQQMALIANAVANQTKPTRLKAALSRLAEESGRQAQLLERLMAVYQIPQSPLSASPLPDDLASVLLDLAFGQYLDAFVLWGWFDLAREKQYLPESFLNLLEPMLDEEACHSVFFANWGAGQRFNVGNSWKRMMLIGRQGSQFLGLLNRFGRQVEDATLPQTASTADIFIGQLTAAQLLNHCIKAHDQRLAKVNPELVKPQLAPQLAQWLLRILKAWPQRQVTPTGSPSNS